MPASHSRMDRVNELIQQEVGDILTTRLRDPRVGFVTVLGAETAPDLRHARIHVSVYGNDDEREDCLEGLKSAAAFIRGELGRRVNLRNIPELRFHIDSSAAQAERLERLFEDLDLPAEQDDDEASSGTP